jgi:hypothetical protein
VLPIFLRGCALICLFPRPVAGKACAAFTGDAAMTLPPKATRTAIVNRKQNEKK